MLRITIPISPEGWDEEKQEFVDSKTQTLQLEHSLVSLSKWESKWCKPFFSSVDKTYEEVLDYIKCMTLTQNVKPEVYNYLTEKNITEITEYINAPMTATTFNEASTKVRGRDIITSAIIFYNSNVQNGVPIAIILQYGHGTRNGGWVEGRDYINPAIQPIFDELKERAWREVTKT